MLLIYTYIYSLSIVLIHTYLYFLYMLLIYTHYPYLLSIILIHISLYSLSILIHTPFPNFLSILLIHTYAESQIAKMMDLFCPSGQWCIFNFRFSETFMKTEISCSQRVYVFQFVFVVYKLLDLFSWNSVEGLSMDRGRTHYIF